MSANTSDIFCLNRGNTYYQGIFWEKAPKPLSTLSR